MRATFDGQVELVSAGERSLAELAGLFTRSFEGYVVPIAMSAEALAAMVRVDGSDLHQSRVLRRNREDVGIVLLARRGVTVRVAAMGVVPAARAQGVGRAALEAILPGLPAAGVRRVVLEAIGGNEPAVGLYRRLGFTVRRQLVGYQRAEPLPAGAPVREIDPAEAVAFLARHGADDLPWQLQPPSLWALGWPTRGFRLDERGVALAGQVPGAVALRALCVRPDERHRAAGRALLAGVAAALEPAPWNVPPIVPEGLADGFLEALGFARMPLFQHEMALELGTPPAPGGASRR